MCARPCEDACRRKEVDAPIGICYLKRVAADYRGETRREAAPPPNGMTAAIIGAGVNGLTTARQLARKGYTVDHLRALPGARRRDVGGRARVAPAARRDHGRGGADHSTSASTSTTTPRVGKDIIVHRPRRATRCGHHLGRLPDRPGTRRSGRGPERRRLRSADSWKMSTSARKTSGSASTS